MKRPWFSILCIIILFFKKTLGYHLDNTFTFYTCYAMYHYLLVFSKPYTCETIRSYVSTSFYKSVLRKRPRTISLFFIMEIWVKKTFLGHCCCHMLPPNYSEAMFCTHHFMSVIFACCIFLHFWFKISEEFYFMLPKLSSNLICIMHVFMLPYNKCY